MNSDEIKSKFQAMTDDFKIQCGEFIDQAQEAFEKIEATVYQNFNKTRIQMVGNAENMKHDVLKANLPRVENFRNNTKIIQDTLDNNYKTFKNDNMGLFSKSLTTFENQIDSVVKKTPIVSTSNYKDVVGRLSKKQKRSLDSAQQKYQTFARALQDNYKDTAHKLTMTLQDMAPKK